MFFNDTSKKVVQMMNNKQLKEDMSIAMQGENYIATMNHEMRTPLASILFFLTYLLDFVGDLPNDNPQKMCAIKYLNLI